jgi:hypothetical protein
MGTINLQRPASTCSESPILSAYLYIYKVKISRIVKINRDDVNDSSHLRHLRHCGNIFSIWNNPARLEGENIVAFEKKNRFASAKSFAELEDMYESAVSPENLHADGERSPAEAQCLFNQIGDDFNARDEELRNA